MKRLIIFLVLGAAVAAAGGCSSDPDTLLGASFVPDSLIQSHPGEVFQDTLFIGNTDTTFVVNSYYANLLSLGPVMAFGRADSFESWMLVRANFATAGEDTLKTVTGAYIRLPAAPSPQMGTLGGLFYELLEPFSEGDTLLTLNLATNPIPDSSGVNVDRTMVGFATRYTLPTSLVQQWIRGTAIHNGIAIVLNDPTTTLRMTYTTRASDDNPSLGVLFSDGTESTYRFIADGTFTRDLTPASELRLSDGEARRIWFPVDLSAIDEEALLHNAELVIEVVPGSPTEGGGFVELYAPEDSVIGGTGILSGPIISQQALEATSNVVEFQVRGVVERFLANPESNFGFALRYFPEGSSIRRIDFYSSAAADTLRPAMRFTFSTPPTFPPDN